MKKIFAAMALVLALAMGAFAQANGQYETGGPVSGTSYTLTNIPAFTDGAFFVPPGACAWTSSGTLGAAETLGLLNSGASNTPVNQVTDTDAGASNNTLTCAITVPSRLTTGKGVAIQDITVLYGVQQTALTSLGAPTVSTITYPTPGASETASTVTPVTAGAVTVTPVVGSANLGLTTAGAFFSEKVALNTAAVATTDFQEFLFQQVFAQAASAAQTVNTPGLLVHYSNVVF